MTNYNRFVRKLIDDPRCLICGEVEENIEHILRCCPTTKNVWRQLGVNDNVVTSCDSFNRWLLKNIDEDNPHSIDGGAILFAIAT